MDSYYYVGVDPGKATGVAVWVPSRDGQPDAWEVDASSYASWAYEFAMAARHMDREITFFNERFTISGRTVRSAPPTHGETGGNPEYWSIELNGVTRHLSRWFNHRFIMHDASAAKRFAPDARLRECGWYRKGPDHVNDALRLLILGMADELHKPPPWVV